MKKILIGLLLLISCAVSVFAAPRYYVDPNGIVHSAGVVSSGTITGPVSASSLNQIKFVSAYSSFNAAITAIGSTPTTLKLDVESTSTGTVVSPTTLSIEGSINGKITKVSGSLTINGPFSAGLYPVFSGFSAEDVTFGSGTVVSTYAIWGAGLTDHNFYSNGIWGSITGTLTNQADLQNTLNGKVTSSVTDTATGLYGRTAGVDGLYTSWSQDFSNNTLSLPSGTQLPATCTANNIYNLTTATSGQRLYLCESTDTWVCNSSPSSTRSTVLLHMNGANASTTFTDSTVGAKTWTVGGAGQITTLTSVFSGASGSFTSSGSSYVSTPAHDDFAFGTGDFTVDYRMRFNTVTTCVVAGQRVDGDNYSTLATYTTTTAYLAWGNGGVTKMDYEFAFAPVAGTWYHVAFVRHGSSFAAYVDGVSKTLVTNTAIGTNSLDAINDMFAIGRQGGLSANYFNGEIDEFRIIKGTAAWLTDFTPPVAEYIQ